MFDVFFALYDYFTKYKYRLRYRLGEKSITSS